MTISQSGKAPVAVATHSGEFLDLPENLSGFERLST
jgi:hypothetical protein